MKKLFCVLLLVLVALSVFSEEIWEKQHPLVQSTVLVAYMFGGMGTGVIVTPDGYLITAGHVIEGGWGEPLVFEPDGYPHSARIVYYSVDKDWAILKIDLPDGAEPLCPVKIGDINTMAVGDPLLTLGHPMGVFWVLSRGIVSGVKFDSNGYQYVFTDAAGAPGSSGSGMYNENLELVAIVQQGISGVGHFGVAGNGLITTITAIILQDRAQQPVRDYLKSQSQRAKDAWEKLMDPDGDNDK